MARAGVGYVAIKGDFGPLYAQLRTQTGPLSSRFGKLGQAVGTAFKLGAAATAGIGVAAIKASAEFNQAMTRVVTQAGATSKEVNKLRGQVLKLAKSSEFTPVELANGLFRVESAGIHGAKAMRILNAAQKLASVGGSDLEGTTRALTAAMQSGIKGTGRASKTVGTLNAAVGEGSLRMEDLVGALSTGVLPAARQFGLTLTDVTSAIATMTRAGVPAQAAATRLRMTFSLMGAPTDKAAGALESIGLKSTALAEAMRKPHGIVVAVQLLRDHLDGLSKVKQAQVLTQAFGGGRSSSTIATLVQNVGSLGKIYTETGKRAGDFGAAVKKQSEEPAARFKVAMSTIKAELVTIGDKLAPKASKEIEKFAKILGDDRLTNDQKFSKIAERISNAFSKAIPVLANVAAKAAPRVAGAFIHGFVNADAWGRLAIAGFLLAKFGGLKAFSAAGAAGGGAFAGGMASTAGGAAAATGLRGALGRLAPIARRAGLFALGFAALNGLSEAMSDKSKQLDLSHKVKNFLHGALAPVGLGGLAPEAKDPTKGLLKQIITGAPLVKKQWTGLADWFGGPGRKSFLKGDFKMIHGRQLIDQSGLSGSAKVALLKVNDLRNKAARIFGHPVHLKVTANEHDLNLVERNFSRLRSHLDFSTKEIGRDVGQNLRLIARTMGLKTRDGRVAVEKNMRLSLVAIRDAMHGGDISARGGMRSILRSFVTNSQASKETTQTNFKAAARAIRQAVHSGELSAGKGTAAIHRLMVENLKMYGFSGAEAKFKVRTGHDPKGAEGRQNLKGAFQRGGPIDGGKPVGDSIPAMLERDEYVLNRKAVKRVGRKVLDRINFGAAPRFQKGGLAGMLGAANRLEKAHFPYVWGGGHSASPAPFGPMDCSGAVSYVLQHGGAKIPTMVSGALAAAGQPGPGKVTVFANAGHTFMRLAGRYFGTSASNPGGGAGWFPAPDAGYLSGFAQRHFDASGEMGGIPRVLVDGPASPLKSIVQGAIDQTRSAATSALNSLISTPVGAGDAEQSGGFSRARLAHLWVRAGGPRNVAALMAKIAIAESGGNPNARNPSGASGLWQILGQVVPGNIFDPLVNAENAVSKWRAGGTAPWDASKSVWSQMAQGGLVGLAGGGFPFGLGHGLGSSDGRPGGGLAGQLGRTLGTLRKSKKPKVRSKALHALLDRLKGIDIPKGLKGKLSKYSQSSNVFGELADRAGQLSTDSGIGPAILGKVNGKTEAQWLGKQLVALLKYRNAIIRGEQQIVAQRERVTKLLELARKRLKQVAVLIRAQSKLRDRLKTRLERARKHPKQNKTLIKALTGQIHGIDGGLKGQVRVRSGLTKIIGDTGSGLMGRRSKLNTVRGDLLTNLEEVQGPAGSAPMGILKKLPAVGVLGGNILTAQLRQRELGQPTDAADTSTDTTSTDTGDTGQADLLRQLLREMTQRAAVSESQFKVLQGFPPFAGSFGGGGVVAGPQGVPRVIQAHGREGVFTPDQMAAMGNVGDVKVIVYGDIVSDRPDPVEVVLGDRRFPAAVEKATRRVTRGGREPLPGRGGGTLR